MARMYLAFLLEFYQPPTQSCAVLDNIIEECYIPIGRLFNCELDPRFSVSITHSLIRLLDDCATIVDVVAPFKQAVDNGSLEIVHSGAFHPIFPLIPTPEVLRQIELDIQLKEKTFQSIPRRGVVSPELCYHDRLLELFASMGFRWTLIDDRIMHMNGVMVPDSEIYHKDGFAVLMRSSFWSDMIREARSQGGYWTGRQFVQHLCAEAQSRTRDCYKIISVNGEIFGHGIKYYQETFLRDMLFAIRECADLHLCQVSDLLEVESLGRIEKRREEGKGFQYFPSNSVATGTEDHLRGDAYPHWKSSGNRIHEKQWELTGLILNACQGLDFSDGNHADLRQLLDQAFYSNQYFSASIWYWNTRPIWEGLDLQMRALYKYARVTGDKQTLERGQRLHTELVWQVFKEEQAPR